MAIRKFFVLMYIVIFFASIILSSNFSLGSTANYYYIDVDVNDDGSITVREEYSLKGEYNGSYKDLNYIGSHKPFTGDKDSFEGSDIYNGTSIIEPIVYDILNHKINNKFELVSSAQNGDYGVYTLHSLPDVGGVKVRIYNPSTYNTDFLIEYTVNDVVILHSDVAEIGWNFFGPDYEESIKELIITFNLPKENNSLKAFTHGPAGGNIEIVNNHTVVVNYNSLPKGTPIDVRLVFDKEVIPKGTKVSNVVALDKILEVEQDRMNIRNKEIRDYYFLSILNVLWLISLIVTLIKVYIKHDKEKTPTFKEKYFREFPGNYGPETLDYLLNKNITPNGLSASILELIRRKHLKVEEGKRKNDYKLILNVTDENDLTKSEKYLIDWFIKNIGNGKEVALREIQRLSGTQSEALKIVKSYEKWKNIVIESNQDNEFFEDNTKVKVRTILYIVITSIMVIILNVLKNYNFLVTFIVILGAIFSTIYLAIFKTRTENGNEDYVRWQAFKRFLNDFGNFENKDLPEIVLWEKYLVFAVVLGVAKKLEKVMKIKLENMYVSPDILNNYTFFYHHSGVFGTNFSTSLSTTVGRSISSAFTYSSRATLGSGGGSSAGGGSFGGGGGGGRF